VRVPFLDLSRQTAALRADLEASIASILDSARFVGGPVVEEFEERWAATCGARHAVGVASGTDAIELALRAVGVEPGDEVITVANTCVPTVAAIEAAEAVPVLVDSRPDTLVIDPHRVAEAMTQRTRAIVPVHLYGRPADVEALRAFGVAIVEDAAQAHGARLRGDAAAFSLYPTKNLGALGDAGVVVTDDEEIAIRTRLLRNYGERDRYDSVRRGTNSRLDTVQAAVLLAKLPRLASWNERRRELAGHYRTELADTGLGLPGDDPGHAWHLFVVRSSRRQAFRAALAEAGIETLVHYPRAVHEHSAYVGIARTALPCAEAASREVVSLPLYPELREDELAAVVEAVRRAAA
jgi:dTDP-3-amino-3,4,6-trideoxy-alpha-D-glucose transaminase